jgi:glycosyltransferase involved in cell wall biosynthesis
MKVKPIVSVCMITYGHENFIEEAIKGVSLQECNFGIELIIANDCSPDQTDEIIQRILKAQPKDFLIKYSKHEKNIGMMPNFSFALQQCKGKYVAICEGDDYWTDPLKLQKQVNFLEANPDYVLCFHPVNILKIDGSILDDFITIVPENCETIETLARLGNYIHTPSVVFRNVIKEFPLEFERSPIGDFFLYMMLAEHGKLKYLEGKMCVYREGVGIWSQKNEYFRNFNTAYLHALLCNYFNNNSFLRSIFTDRIKNFLQSFEDEISVDNFVQLGLNEVLQKEILEVVVLKNAVLKKELIYYKSTKNLVFELSQILKRKLWKR